MNLSWNEIMDNAVRFSKKWENATREEADAQSFLREFFEVFGIKDIRSAGEFEYVVKKDDSQKGYIDFLLPSKIAVEMKSSGKDLKKAYTQLKEYVVHLKIEDIPELLMVCDFKNIWLYSRTADSQVKFKTKNLKDHVKHFSLIAGYETTRVYDEQREVNILASEKMAKLHNAMEAVGYDGHALQVYLVRLLFCLFADDTGIFPKDAFLNYIENSHEDGSDLSGRLEKLFQVLNTDSDTRKKNTLLSLELLQFQYVNGGLFAERLLTADFDSKMRQLLIDAGKFNWQYISPAIFGSMFQGVMNREERHDLGAHYTSEENILKVINPLFMDELWEEFERVKTLPLLLDAFHKKIASLKFLDPACGCGNFLIIAYRELRKLEYAILRMKRDSHQLLIDPTLLLKVNVSQFFGMELLDFPCQVAQVGMWLMDHLMNLKMAEEFGIPYVRLPLKQSAKIVCCNALTTDWNEVVPSSELSYILGNPPFIGGKIMNKEQKTEILRIVGKVNRAASIDYVVGWYYKAAEYIKNTNSKAAFVSTNSITQGAQIEPIWKKLFIEYHIEINFAYRTFVWDNEASHKAKVHCVIIGFSSPGNRVKKIYEGKNEKICKNISPYLIDSKNIFIKNRSKPICEVPPMDYGNMPNDGGYFIFTHEEKEEFLKEEPEAEKFFRIYQGSDDYINNKIRYCLWLVDIKAAELKKYPKIRERISLVKETRLKSSAAPTREKAKIPHKFFYISQPSTDYLFIPRVSSENRKYIPIGFVSPDIIASDASSIIANATLYLFAILTSSVHMAWVRVIAGRLKSDFRYSAGIVYNNFPWVEEVDQKQKAKIEKLAQAVLDARANHAGESLADLYGDLMPDDLRKAHENLDKAVLALYGFKKNASEDSIVAELLERYEKLAAVNDQLLIE